MDGKGTFIAIAIIFVFLVAGLFYWFGIQQGDEPGNNQVAVTPTTQPGSVSPPPGDDTNEPPTVSEIQLFLIVLEDGGEMGREVGCGDSVVPVTQAIPETTTPLQSAYEELLSYEASGESDYYNALSQSDLTVDSAVIENETAIVRLTGDLQLGGVCDNPRVESQLRETALQFSTVSQVQIFINGERLEEALSLQ